MTFINTVEKASDSLYHDITEELSRQSLKRYNHGEFTLVQLDHWRVDTLPDILKARYLETDETWLESEELILLMDWKLAKGKFRPMLPKLIRSNSPETVKDITKSGLRLLLNFFKENSDKLCYQVDRSAFISVVKDAVKKTSELKGVGPATASLILSLLVKINPMLAPPFFSDESFIYYVVEPSRPGSKIKYNSKEYTEELLPVYFEILSAKNSVSKLNMNCLERGGWALKMYDLYRITKLVEVKPKFEVEDSVLVKYSGVENKNHDIENCEDLADGQDNALNNGDGIKPPRAKKLKSK